MGLRYPNAYRAIAQYPSIQYPPLPFSYPLAILLSAPLSTEANERKVQSIFMRPRAIPRAILVCEEGKKSGGRGGGLVVGLVLSDQESHIIVPVFYLGIYHHNKKVPPNSSPKKHPNKSTHTASFRSPASSLLSSSPPLLPPLFINLICLSSPLLLPLLLLG